MPAVRVLFGAPETTERFDEWTPAGPGAALAPAQMIVALMTRLYFLNVCQRIVLPLAPKSVTAKPGDVVISDPQMKNAILLRGRRQCRVVHRFCAHSEDGGAAILEGLEDGRLSPYDRTPEDRILAAISSGGPVPEAAP